MAHPAVTGVQLPVGRFFNVGTYHPACLPRVGTIAFQEKVLNVLKTKLGLSNFRPGQMEAIHAITEQKRSFLLIFSTGGGKSLVYIMIFLLLGKVVFVIEPLISVMYDQQRSIQKFVAANKGLEITTLCIAAGRNTDKELEDMSKGLDNIGLHQL